MGGKWAHPPASRLTEKEEETRSPCFPITSSSSMLCKKIYVWTAQQWTVKFTVNFVFLFPRTPFFGCAPSRPARSQWTLKWLRRERNWTLAQLNNSRVLFTSSTCFCLYTFLSANSRVSRPKILRKGFPLKHFVWKSPGQFSSILASFKSLVIDVSLKTSQMKEKRFVNFSSALCGEEKRRKLLAGLMKTVNTHRHTHGSQ